MLIHMLLSVQLMVNGTYVVVVQCSSFLQSEAVNGKRPEPDRTVPGIWPLRLLSKYCPFRMSSVSINDPTASSKAEKWAVQTSTSCLRSRTTILFNEEVAKRGGWAPSLYSDAR